MRRLSVLTLACTLLPQLPTSAAQLGFACTVTFTDTGSRPCCTARTHEFLVDGVLHLALRVVGHGWFPAQLGRIEDINDEGILVDADGTERHLHWRADREGT